MNGEQLNLYFALLTLIIVWNIGLSIYLFQAVAKYKRLTRGTNNRNLEQIVEKLIERQENEAKHVVQVSQDLVGFQKKSAVFFQKSALMRFNPFEDAGGDQSFVAVILDGNDSGFIISSLHSRSGTRIYAKDVKSGKSAAHALTREEKEALEKALKSK